MATARLAAARAAAGVGRLRERGGARHPAAHRGAPREAAARPRPPRQDAGALGRPLPPPATQAVVKGRLHSPARDRSAISHHDDLSNDFYAFLLDPHLAYSCAWFVDGPDMPLIRQRGLEGRVEIRLQDYREVDSGPFDAVASLEMGEHVGQGNYPAYAEVVARSLVPGGYALVQQMSRFDRHRGGGPFIEQFIAPDMTMRPAGETLGMLEAAGLEVRGLHALREHYVWTVDAWHRTLESQWDRAVELVGEEAARVWRLYLVGGSQAFRDGRMGVDQILLRRPGGPAVVADPAAR